MFKKFLRIITPNIILKLRRRILVGLTGSSSQNFLEKRRRQNLIKKAETVEDVKKICGELNFTYFLDYDDQIETKQREFLNAIDFFSLSLQGKDVLDVGPGTADSLDVAKARGASKTFFIEEEDVFVRFAEIKGHSGICKNYTYKPYFPKEMRNSFDIVYTKGSINCVWVDQQQKLIDEGDPNGFFDFEKWVNELKTLVKKGGQIILVPAMDKQSKRIIDEEYDLDTFYWCPDLEAYKASFFTRTLVNNGFTMHENITGFTHKKAFPIAFSFK